jgi:hypothetical protein
MLFCTVLCATFCSGLAVAEENIFRDWFAACDNVRNCSAFGFNGGVINTGAYVRIDRGGAPKTAPQIAVFVSIEKGKRFKLSFDDLTTDGLPNHPITAITAPREDTDKLVEPDDDGSTKVEITAVEPFLAALRKAGKITVEQLDAPTQAEPIEISLAGASAALLWIDERQRRLDTVTALVRRGKKPATPAVPRPPLPAVVRAAKPGVGPIPKTFPPAVAAKISEACSDEYEDAFGSEIGEAAHLSGNLLLYWFECHNRSGAYNPSRAFVIAPQDKPAAVRKAELPLPPGKRRDGKATTHLALGAYFNTKTQTLHSIGLAHGPGDCGETYDWVWDGKAFRLTETRSMPVCKGLIPKHWPVVYRATRR